MCYLLALCALATAGGESIDLQRAARYFQEAREAAERDGGKLWGVPLHGPMLFADPTTRSAVGNQRDQEGLLVRKGAVFVGTLPQTIGISNTSVHWGGLDWTMVMWPPPDDPHERVALMMHESFHRVQERIGIAGSDPACDHLAEREGRIWLRLEWRALARALAASGDSRHEAIRDALLFRAYRCALFESAEERERTLERHEGLAEYTGTALSGRSRDAQRAWAAQKLREAESNKSYVRSFAYASGPAYALLLDDLADDWRRAIRNGDGLGILLQAAIGPPSRKDLETNARERAGQYDAQTVRAEEVERAERHAKLVQRYRERLVDGPHLHLSLQRPNVTFDPRTPVPIKGLGTVYPGMTLRDVWGVLTVTTGGALLYSDWSAVRVSAPTDAAQPLRGEGWTLEPADGWAVQPGARAGDFVLVRG